MASEDTKPYSRSEIAAMKAKGDVRATPADAPELTLDEAFWPRPNSRVTRGHLEARRGFGNGLHVSKAL